MNTTSSSTVIPTFADVLLAKLLTHPVLSTLPTDAGTDTKRVLANEAAYKLTIATMDTWDGISVYGWEGLRDDFGWTDKEAKALERLAKAEAKEEEKIGTQVAATVTLTSTDEDPMFGQWHALRQGPASIAGFTARQINASWTPENVVGFGRGGGTLLMDAGGVNIAVAEMVKSRGDGGGARINDPTVRQLMFAYKRALAGTDFLAENDRRAYLKVMTDVFDKRDMQILAAFAAVFNRRATSEILGPKATVSVGSESFSPQDMLDGLSRICKKADEAASRSDFTEAMTYMVEGEYEPFVLKLLRNIMFQRLMGVLEPNEKDPNVTAIEALATRGYEEAGDYLLAGMRAAEMFRRISLFDPNAPLDAGFFAFVGEGISAYLSSAQGLDLDGKEEVAEVAELPFHSNTSPSERRSEARSTARGWKINIFFGVNVSRF